MAMVTMKMVRMTDDERKRANEPYQNQTNISTINNNNTNRESSNDKLHSSSSSSSVNVSNPSISILITSLSANASVKHDEAISQSQHHHIPSSSLVVTNNSNIPANFNQSVANKDNVNSSKQSTVTASLLCKLPPSNSTQLSSASSSNHHHRQLINLNKTNSNSTSNRLNQPIILNLNTMSSSSVCNNLVPILTTTKLSSSNTNNNKLILSSNLFTPTPQTNMETKCLAGQNAASLTVLTRNDFDDSSLFLADSDEEKRSGCELDDSLTSLQWLQNLNVLKPSSSSSTISTTPSETTGAAGSKSFAIADNKSPQASQQHQQSSSNLVLLSQNAYPPLTPPLSIQCSSSPPLSSCSSLISNQSSTANSNTASTPSIPSTKGRRKNASTNATTTLKSSVENSSSDHVSKLLQQQQNVGTESNETPKQTSNTSSSAYSTSLSRQTSTLSHTTSLFNKDREDYRTNPQLKPPFSYSQLIILSMRESRYAKMTLQMIYDWIIENFVYFKKADPSWQVTFKNSIRHNLSLNKCFQKIARQKEEPGKGGFWTLDPDFEKQIAADTGFCPNSFQKSNIDSEKSGGESDKKSNTGIKRRRGPNAKTASNASINSLLYSGNLKEPDSVITDCSPRSATLNLDYGVLTEAPGFSLDDCQSKRFKNDHSTHQEAHPFQTNEVAYLNQTSEIYTIRNNESQRPAESCTNANNHSSNFLLNTTASNQFSIMNIADLDASISSVLLKSDAHWSDLNKTTTNGNFVYHENTNNHTSHTSSDNNPTNAHSSAGAGAFSFNGATVDSNPGMFINSQAGQNANSFIDSSSYEPTVTSSTNFSSNNSSTINYSSSATDHPPTQHQHSHSDNFISIPDFNTNSQFANTSNSNSNSSHLNNHHSYHPSFSSNNTNYSNHHHDHGHRFVTEETPTTASSSNSSFVNHQNIDNLINHSNVPHNPTHQDDVFTNFESTLANFELDNHHHNGINYHRHSVNCDNHPNSHDHHTTELAELFDYPHSFNMVEASSNLISHNNSLNSVGSNDVSSSSSSPNAFNMVNDLNGCSYRKRNNSSSSLSFEEDENMRLARQNHDQHHHHQQQQQQIQRHPGDEEHLDLTVQGHCINKPKWWQEGNLFTIESHQNGNESNHNGGCFVIRPNVITPNKTNAVVSDARRFTQSHQDQDDECDSSLYQNQQHIVSGEVQNIEYNSQFQTVVESAPMQILVAEGSMFNNTVIEMPPQELQPIQIQIDLEPSQSQNINNQSQQYNKQSKCYKRNSTNRQANNIILLSPLSGNKIERKRIYTHQNKLNPAIHKSITLIKSKAAALMANNTSNSESSSKTL